MLKRSVTLLIGYLITGVCCISRPSHPTFFCCRAVHFVVEIGSRGQRRPHRERLAFAWSCPPAWGTRHPSWGLAPDPHERAASLPLPPEARRDPWSPLQPGLLQLQSTAVHRFPREKAPTTDASCRASQAWRQPWPSWPSSGALGADRIGVVVAQCVWLWLSGVLGGPPLAYASRHCMTRYSSWSTPLAAAPRSLPGVWYAMPSVVARGAYQWRRPPVDRVGGRAGRESRREP